ncbi:MAG: response regulator [Acidobacteria bacterium]|nr:response regulator [Acidobacteriota bacterium]
MPHKLLLADDSVTIQRVIELTFADEDITVIAVGDGRQAIEWARTERPDIVLADVGMPERDGYEVAAFIKNTPDLAHIPVLLLTGAFEPIDEGRARAARCDGVLIKPFEPQMVINRVKDLIAGRRSPMGDAPTSSVPSTLDSPQALPQGTAAPSVEDYFDRLDAAFSAKESGAAATTDAQMGSELVTWDSELPPPVARPAATPPPPAENGPKGGPPGRVESGAPVDRAASAPVPTLAEAFAALLSVEQGHGIAAASPRRADVNDDVVEQVTQRVIERMTDGAVRDVVLDVAERLVREEIARIKAQAR